MHGTQLLLLITLIDHTARSHISIWLKTLHCIQSSCSFSVQMCRITEAGFGNEMIIYTLTYAIYPPVVSV